MGTVDFERQDHVAVITVSNEPVKNALTVDMARELGGSACRSQPPSGSIPAPALTRATTGEKVPLRSRKDVNLDGPDDDASPRPARPSSTRPSAGHRRRRVLGVPRDPLRLTVPRDPTPS